jgi:flagellar biosynthesis protein FlhF
MHVKRLYRPSVREALAAAREELGPGALVLSTEMVPAPGWRGWLGRRVVRLTAATERAGTDQPAVDPVSADRPEPPEPRHRPARILDPAREGVIARLSAAGIDRDLALAVANRLTAAECRGGSDLAIRRAIAAELAEICSADAACARYEVFVGPPGVGKTTTIAKIAARERARGEAAPGLVAADTSRAGAVEQLRGYADIIGAPLRVARGAGELEQALAGLRRTVLVDTAGRAPTDEAIADLFGVLAGKRQLRTHLVLAADTSRATADRLLARYACLQPSRVVITKLDESETVMPLLSAVREHGLPISYLTAGQRVPDDLWQATPANLAAALLHETDVEGVTCH